MPAEQLVKDFKDNVSGVLASATDTTPVLIHRYAPPKSPEAPPYRAIVTGEWLRRAQQAIREQEEREEEAPSAHEHDS